MTDTVLASYITAQATIEAARINRNAVFGGASIAGFFAFLASPAGKDWLTCLISWLGR